MKLSALVISLVLSLTAVYAQVRISSLSNSGVLVVTNTFSNGVLGVETAEDVTGSWRPCLNSFTTGAVAQVQPVAAGDAAFFRAWVTDLSGGRAGFTNLTRAYGLLEALAGAGAPQEQINWRSEFEGAPAPSVLLSSPHITIADRVGNYFIADKDAHGVRKVRPDGTIVTVAGINLPGNGPDYATMAPACALNAANASGCVATAPSISST